MLQDVYYWNDPVQVFPWRRVYWGATRASFVLGRAHIWVVGTWLADVSTASKICLFFVLLVVSNSVRAIVVVLICVIFFCRDVDTMGIWIDTRKKQNKTKQNKTKNKQNDDTQIPKPKKKDAQASGLNWVSKSKTPLAHTTCWRMVNWNAFAAQY